MELVEAGDDRQRMIDRCRGVAVSQARLARAHVHAPRLRRCWVAPVALRVLRRAQPYHHFADLAPAGVLPPHTHRGQQPEPAQQVERVAATCRRGTIARHQFPKELADRLNLHALAIDDQERQ